MERTLKAFCLIFEILPSWNTVYFLWQEWKKHLPLLLTPTGFQLSSELDPANPCKFLGVGIQTLNTEKQNNKNKNTLLKEMKIKNMLSCYTHQNWMKKYFIPYYEQNMSVSCCLGPRDPWIMVSYSSISSWTRQAAPSLSAGPKKVRHR